MDCATSERPECRLISTVNSSVGHRSIVMLKTIEPARTHTRKRASAQTSKHANTHALERTQASKTARVPAHFQHMLTHARVHAHTHPQTHAHIHARTPARTHELAPIRPPACLLAPVIWRILIQINAWPRLESAKNTSKAS